MIYLLYFIHIVISLFLIAIVLLQQGKGAGLSAPAAPPRCCTS
jgi:protein translocase SecG subunit